MNVEGAVVGIEKNKSKAVKAYGAMGEEMLAEVDSGLAAVNDKLKSSIGEIETGFSAKATVEAVSASVPADLTGRGGGATTSGGGDTNVVNHFHIAELVVREEADVKKISRELYNMQKSKSGRNAQRKIIINYCRNTPKSGASIVTPSMKGTYSSVMQMKNWYSKQKKIM